MVGEFAQLEQNVKFYILAGLEQKDGILNNFCSWNLSLGICAS